MERTSGLLASLSDCFRDLRMNAVKSHFSPHARISFRVQLGHDSSEDTADEETMHKTREQAKDTETRRTDAVLRHYSAQINQTNHPAIDAKTESPNSIAIGIEPSLTKITLGLKRSISLRRCVKTPFSKSVLYKQPSASAS